MTLQDFGKAFKKELKNRNFLTTENINKSDRLYLNKVDALQTISECFYSIPSISGDQKNLSLILENFNYSLHYLDDDADFNRVWSKKDKQENKIDWKRIKWIADDKILNPGRSLQSCFWPIFPDKIRNTNDSLFIKKIKNLVKSCFSRFGPLIDSEIRETEKKFKLLDFKIFLSKNSLEESDIDRAEEIYDDFCEKYSKEQKSNFVRDCVFKVLNNKLYKSLNAAKKNRKERVKREKENKTNLEKDARIQKENFDFILKEISKVEFVRDLAGKKNVVFHESFQHEYGTSVFYIGDWKQGIKEQIDSLNDDLLEVGKKKTDLLDTLEKTIQDNAPFYYETSPHEEIKEEPVSDYEKMLKDNKSEYISKIKQFFHGTSLTNNDLDESNRDWEKNINSCNGVAEMIDMWSKVQQDIDRKKSKEETPTKKTNQAQEQKERKSKTKPTEDEWGKLVAETQKSAISKIKTSLQISGLSNSDLDSSNKDWDRQISAAAKEENVCKIQDIEVRVLSDINSKRKIKENSIKLEEIKESISENSNLKEEDIKNNISECNKNLGDKENQNKVQETKDLMIEKNSAGYQKAVTSVLKEDMTKYGIKESELSTEEKTLINNNGTELENKEFRKIEDKLAEKVAEKKEGWNLLQIIKEGQELLKLKTKLALDHLEREVKKIKEQIYNFSSSSNDNKKKVYKKNEKEVKNLLSQLQDVSVYSKPLTTKQSKQIPWPVIIPVSLAGLLVVLAMVFIRVRRKKR